MQSKTKELDAIVLTAVEMVGRMTREQEEQLRERLNVRHMQRRIRRVVSGRFVLDTTNSLSGFVNQLGSGDIDLAIAKASADVWQDAVHKFEAVAEVFSEPESAEEDSAKDSEETIEAAYLVMQANLLQVRQAVAQAIATEKQFEQQISRNQEQIATWTSRALEATKQGNSDLASAARQRQEQYEQAAIELEKMLRDQKTSCMNLRLRLTELEITVGKAYTQKQMLIAKKRSETAEFALNEMLKHFRKDSTLFDVDLEPSHDASASRSASGVDGKMPSQELLERAVTALESATAAIRRLESLILEQEAQRKPPEQPSDTN